MKPSVPTSLSRSWLAFIAAVAITGGCERPARVVAPNDELTRQSANSTGLSVLQFNVTRADNGAPVQYATVSVYLDPNATTPPTLCASGEVVIARNCWVVTDALGQANIQVPTGGGVAYLARLLPPEWLNQSSIVWPPLNPGAFTTVANDLGALTCGRRSPVDFTPGHYTQCLSNLYFIPRGPSETINLALPLAGTHGVVVKDVQGNVVSSGVYAYLIEALQQTPPWLTLPQGVKAGFLRFYGLAPADLPGSAGYVEVYGSGADGFEIAGTQPVPAGGGAATVETSPVICANGTENVPYSITRNPTSQPFSFTDATWAFAAFRGATAALDKDLTTTVVVLKFSETGGPHTVTISQRMRTANGTLTAGATVLCTDGICDVANAVLSTPGSSNPMTPHLYQPKAGKLFWVVQNVDPTADSEWSAKSPYDQIPNPSKKTASSAFQLFSKAFTFCDPNFSFDGSWGASI